MMFRSNQTIRRLVTAVVVVVTLYVAASAVRFYARKYHLFLPDYVRWAFTPAPDVSGPKHLFFFFVDHYEAKTDAERSKRWAQRFATMASRHRDSNGRVPQHTWFYPGEQPFDPHMHQLRSLVDRGFGEVELHLHHRHDTTETLDAKLAASIDYLQRFGFIRTIDGQTRFGFIHGNSSLDNSIEGLCGVQDELQLLKAHGGYADFTFPNVWKDSQPPFVNRIYEAVDDPGPRSYKKASAALGSGDLTIVTGPLLFAPTWSVRRLFLEVEDANIHPAVPATPRRVDRWVHANVHVPERPDWVFIKVSSHSASSDADEEEVLGGNYESVLTHLEREYNDGQRYVLHYVTAREAYNLARAAAAGQQGPPGEYFDWVVKPYVSSAGAPRPIAAGRMAGWREQPAESVAPTGAR